MPLYEYYCDPCNGIFETIRPMREASEPVPCPVCSKDAPRIMSSFSAFTFRDGYPRRIPDKGTYWHLGKEVKKPITGAARMNEHPELTKPKPRPRPNKGEREIMRDKQQIEAKDAARRRRDGVPEIKTRMPRKLD